jgi:ornithine cyclodeaminase
MIQSNEAETRRALPWTDLIEAIRHGFRADWSMPVKHQHFVPVPGEPDAKLMMMPAWAEGEHIAVKVVNLFPGNSARGLPAVNAMVMLMDGRTGECLALIDGGEVTARRTAATSALAADYLARADSRHLVVVGTGRVAGDKLVEAHTVLRPIDRITVWGRDFQKAETVAARVSGGGIAASATEDLATAVADADIVTCATLSQTPLIRGEWLKPGAHVDLVGAYSPTSREADDEAIRRATVFVDTRAGAPHATGDIVEPLKSGVLKEEDVVADLFDLTRGLHSGRRDPDEITLFKSVGAAIEDLAAARLVYARCAGDAA